MQCIHLLIGVPGSGKTWAAKQLTDKYDYVPHDDHAVADYHKVLIRQARFTDKPVLAEAPFRASVLVEQLVNAGIPVKEWYVIERPEVVKSRYEARDNKPLPKQHLTNLIRYTERAWAQPGHYGTSEQIVNILRNY